MKPTLLDCGPVTVDGRQVAERLGLSPDPDLEAELGGLAAQASRVARPRAVYADAFVEERTEDATVIGGIRFHSRVLGVNLRDVHRVFPFVVTSGLEVEVWSQEITDPLMRFHADTVKELVLYQAAERLAAHIDQAFALKGATAMNPGSLEDWPLSEQAPLFRLLGDVKAMIGVTLTESFLMHPVKSVSGIRFPAEASFESCMLCPRESCPNRRAPYDPQLFQTRYQGALGHG